MIRRPRVEVFTLQRRFVFLGFHRIIELKNGLFSSGYEPRIAITNKKVRCQTILKTKPSTSRNLDRLTSAKVPHENLLRSGLKMSDCQASSNPRNCFVFHNSAPQSKVVTVNIKRKIFSFLTRQS